MSFVMIISCIINYNHYNILYYTIYTIIYTIIKIEDVSTYKIPTTILLHFDGKLIIIVTCVYNNIGSDFITDCFQKKYDIILLDI